MLRVSCTAAVQDTRLDRLIAWLNQTPAAAATTIEPASADASFRRYFRVYLPAGDSLVVMDAPPPQENVASFLRMNAILRAAGLHAPEVLAAEPEVGFLLLEDLGRQTYLQAFAELDQAGCDALMREAIAALVRLQAIERTHLPADFPRYDAALLRQELELFPAWYVGRHRNLELSTSERESLERSFALLIGFALAQPPVLVHRDYMPRNLMVLPRGGPGILDHQDAVIGPITYDLASLLRDAFHSWEEEQVLDWAVRYWEAARRMRLPVPEDFGTFYRDLEWMGLQRHLKVLGIFARIHYRDGKAHYLADTPRFIGYVRHTANRYEAFSPLLRLLDRLEGIEPAVGYTF